MLQLDRVRTRIATDWHADIRASLSQIAALSVVARMDADRGGQVQEPLSRITGISGELVDLPAIIRPCASSVDAAPVWKIAHPNPTTVTHPCPGPCSSRAPAIQTHPMALADADRE
jgi:hypothetical protein